MKRTVALVLFIALLFTLVLSLSSCAAYKTVEHDFDIDYEAVMDYFESIDYEVEGYKVITHPTTEHSPYYQIEVVSNAQKKNHRYGMAITFCGTHEGAIAYCKNHLDEKRTFIDELFEIIGGVKPYSSFTAYGRLCVRYNYEEDLNRLIEYIDSLEE